MVKSFNISDSKVSRLRGTHYAKSVYCAKLVKHPGDVHYAWLKCDELVEGEIPDANADWLETEDRIYKGELHIRGIYGQDELGVDEA